MNTNNFNNEENKPKNKKFIIDFGSEGDNKDIIAENPSVEEEYNVNSKFEIKNGQAINNIFSSKESPSTNNNTNASDGELKVNIKLLTPMLFCHNF